MDNFDLKKYLVENKLTTQSKLISEVEFKRWSEINTDEFPEGTEFFNGNFGQKFVRYPGETELKKISGPRPDDDENSSDLDFDDFLKKFPEVKDDNLAGEVYDIMQQQNGFDNYDDEDIVSFMKAAATWTDAEDVANYFKEPASDIGRLIASYYQEESGYEGFNDKWDNYLDHLFHKTEREGNDIDDWRIEDGDKPAVKKEKKLISFKDAFIKDPSDEQKGIGSVYAVADVDMDTGPNPEGFYVDSILAYTLNFVDRAFKEENQSNGKYGHFRDDSYVWDKGGSKDDYLSKEQQEEIINTNYQEDLLDPWSEGKLSNKDLYDKYVKLYYPLFSLI